jgi:hypothetical protein
MGARERRNLEPKEDIDPFDVDRAVRDALAVYYFPGMWDWSRAVAIPLVFRALDDALDRERRRLGGDAPPHFEARAAAARELLQAYVDWAPEVEQVAPVLIEVDYEADLADPLDPESGLFTATGANIRYRGRLDMLAVDQHDAYWIVRHHVAREWTPLDALVRNEEAVAACWAWERFYIGMEIAGTIHNELMLPTAGVPEGSGGGRLQGTERERGGLPQSEGSGGGRSLPQHRRLYAKAAEPVDPARIEHHAGMWFRRTWIRRSRSEIAAAGRQLATEAREMCSPDVAVYPSPSPSNCRRCPYAAPCQALFEGRDAEADAILSSSYQPRSREDQVEGRLGGVTWSIGRGAAPPTFSAPPP